MVTFMYSIETWIDSNLYEIDLFNIFEFEQKLAKRTKTISRFGCRISDRRRLANSSSVAPSKRLGFVIGLEDLRLLLLGVTGCGEVGIGVEGEDDVVLFMMVDIDGRGEDDEGDGETTFIIGDIIVFKVEDDGVVGWQGRTSVFILICSKGFCSFPVTVVVSRLSDSRNFDKNTSATSSEPKLLFSALNQMKKQTVYAEAEIPL